MLFNNYSFRKFDVCRCQRLCGIGFHQTTPRLHATTPHRFFGFFRHVIRTEGGAFIFLLFFIFIFIFFFVLSYVGQVVRDRQDQPSLKGILRLPVGAPQLSFLLVGELPPPSDVDDVASLLLCQWPRHSTRRIYTG